MDLHSVSLYFTSKFIRAMCNLQSPLLLDRKLKPKNRFIHSVHNLLDRPTTITTSLPSTHPSTHTPLNSSESGIFFFTPTLTQTCSTNHTTNFTFTTRLVVKVKFLSPLNLHPRALSLSKCAVTPFRPPPPRQP